MALSLSQYDKYLAGVKNSASSVPFEAAGFFNFSIFFLINENDLETRTAIYQTRK
jgi:hypothetical protein